MLQFIRRLTATASDAPYVSSDTPLPANVLRKLGVSRVIAVTAATAPATLTATTEAISLKAIGCAMAIRIGVGAQAAVLTDHYIADGERLDLAVAPGSTLAAIAVSGSGSLKISELV